MMSFRLPLWVYWTIAGVGVAGATWFTLSFDFSTADPVFARQLLFTVWGGPLTLVIAASLITWLHRTRRR
jgi:hypothetical protein